MAFLPINPPLNTGFSLDLNHFQTKIKDIFFLLTGTIFHRVVGKRGGHEIFARQDQPVYKNCAARIFLGFFAHKPPPPLKTVFSPDLTHFQTKIQDILVYFLKTSTIFLRVIGKRGGPWPNGPPPIYATGLWKFLRTSCSIDRGIRATPL